MDKRFHAFRDDLADISLSGKVESENFVSGRRYLVGSPLSNLYLRADLDSLCLCQLVYGCSIICFDYGTEWSWVQNETDNYVGYIRSCDLTDIVTDYTHHVCVPYTCVYSAADLKSRLLFCLPMNSRVNITKFNAENGFVKDCNNRYIFASHLLSKANFNADIVSVCSNFLWTPYLWGGDSWLGIDCSGLLCQSFRSCGLYCDRDSDMQFRFLGKRVDGENLKRGILVFFDDHVGIMCNKHDFLHSSAYSMRVEIEKLSNVCKRIGEPIGYKQLD